MESEGRGKGNEEGKEGKWSPISPLTQGQCSLRPALVLLTRCVDIEVENRDRIAVAINYVVV